jgi:hypothetical protein
VAGGVRDRPERLDTRHDSGSDDIARAGDSSAMSRRTIWMVRLTWLASGRRGG